MAALWFEEAYQGDYPTTQCGDLWRRRWTRQRETLARARDGATVQKTKRARLDDAMANVQCRAARNLSVAVPVSGVLHAKRNNCTGQH